MNKEFRMMKSVRNSLFLVLLFDIYMLVVFLCSIKLFPASAFKPPFH